MPQDLEGRLSRYQGKCDQLQLKNDELQKQLHQQLEDQEQMITFLKKKGQDQTEAYIDLEEKLAALMKVSQSFKTRASYSSIMLLQTILEIQFS